MLIMRGPGGFHGGRVSDALVSQIDLFPTLCELAGIEPPPWLQGRSLMPLARREADEVNDAVFTSSPTTPRTSPSARSAPGATSTSGATASGRHPCSPTSTTARPRTR